MRIVVGSALCLALMLGLSSVASAQSRYDRNRSGDNASYQGDDGQYSDQSGDTAGDNGAYSDRSGDSANHESNDGGSTDQDQSGDTANYSGDDGGSSYQDQSDDTASYGGDDGGSADQDRSGDSASYSDDDNSYSGRYGAAAGGSGDRAADCYVNRRGRTVCR